MALDEPRDTDEVFKVDGFEYIIDKEFLEKVQPIKVDFMHYGFSVDCAVDFNAESCGSCSTTGTCCG